MKANRVQTPPPPPPPPRVRSDHSVASVADRPLVFMPYCCVERDGEQSPGPKRVCAIQSQTDRSGPVRADNSSPFQGLQPICVPGQWNSIGPPRFSLTFFFHQLFLPETLTAEWR